MENTSCTKLSPIASQQRELGDAYVLSILLSVTRLADQFIFRVGKYHAEGFDLSNVLQIEVS